ncbi:hypothetical protein BDR03DRAFT_980452 [Suillus americanus]|nr:hypothetical protein BDR03DRAFT_980452 [Suillus americanus]
MISTIFDGVAHVTVTGCLGAFFFKETVVDRIYGFPQVGISVGMGNPYGSWVWVVGGLGMGWLMVTHHQPMTHMQVSAKAHREGQGIPTGHQKDSKILMGLVKDKDVLAVAMLADVEGDEDGLDDGWDDIWL